MDYTIVRRRGQKNIRMHFNDAGKLMVSAPYFVSEHDIDAFVISNSDWIEKQRSKQIEHSFSTGDCLYLFGSKYDLVVNQSPENSVGIAGTLMIVYVRKAESAYVSQILKKYFTKYLYEFVFPKVQHWTETLGLNMPSVKICNAKTRWGVCFKSHNLIKISLMTVTLDERLIDMIVLHEVCHLVYLNHQKEFWNLMREYMPDVEERKKALRAESRKGYHRNLF